jgi:hypothetical protein
VAWLEAAFELSLREMVETWDHIQANVSSDECVF